MEGFWKEATPELCFLENYSSLVTCARHCTTQTRYITSFMPPSTCEAGTMITTLILQMGKLGFGEEKSLALVT